MTHSRGRRAGRLSILVATIALGACVSATPSDSPAASAPAGSPVSTASAAVPASTSEPTPAATAISAATATPAPPTPTPTPAPPAGPLNVTWHRETDPATSTAGDWEPLEGVRNQTWTRLGGRYVISLNTSDFGEEPQVWASTDALHWTRQTLPHDPGETLSVSAVTLGGPGLVALGVNSSGDSPTDAFWSSADGLRWNRVSKTSLTVAQDWLLRATANGNVTFADGPVDVTTYHGPSGDPHDFGAIVDTAGSLTAFETAASNSKPVLVWSASTGPWQNIGELLKSDGGTVLQAAHGPRGWYVRGCGKECATELAWFSTDGTTWTPSSTTDLPRSRAILADESGFIAVGERITGTGCVVTPWEIYGETWTSSDGLHWRKLPDQKTFDHAAIRFLIVKDRTLIGIGVAWPAQGQPDVPSRATAWTASLPADSSVDTSPIPTPTPPPARIGCGE